MYNYREHSLHFPHTHMDSALFYIVDEELALLPENVRRTWEARLVKETLTAYETPQQIDARMSAVNYKKFPGLQKKIEQYAKDFSAGNASNVSFEDFPEEALGSFLFSIGASGISAYIALYLHSP